MHLYHLTLQRATGIAQAVYGNFSAQKTQEVVVSHGNSLELLRPDDTGKIQSIHSVEVFGAIRCLDAFRLAGGSRDYVAVGSDSGRIVILFFNQKTNCFERVHQETFGKSGSRRIVPGQYIATDPKGRAIMIGAVEKQKLVYVLNRDSEANLTISSPLESHKSHTLCWHICAIDRGYENPYFAAIELDYADIDQDPSGDAFEQAQKMLTFYELDLGLNHVVRKSTKPIDNGANLLVAVPGSQDGPGGVLLCCENVVYHIDENQEEIRCVIPRREDLPEERGILITASSTYKTKSTLFFLLQSEYGDLYKVTLDHEKQKVKDMKVSYFDSIPPAVSICIMRQGFLFTASSFSDHKLFQFKALADDEEAFASASSVMETDDGQQPVLFRQRPLKNLVLVDSMESPSPIVDMKSSNMLNEETPQLYAACGASSRSCLKILRQGMALSELAVSDLPGTPSAVWTVKVSHKHENDAYIIVSFVNATLVLSVGETVEEVSDSGFLNNAATLHVALLRDDTYVQVHESGLRHIGQDKRANEWKTPGRKRVLKVASNATQVALALDGGEVVYFELEEGQQLMERDKKDMAGDIACLALGEVPYQRQRAPFLAVGLYDSTVRILRLDPEAYLQSTAVQALASPPESLLITDIPTGIAGELTTTFLNIGLSNGILLRTVIDAATGQLSDTRTRFLGAKAPKLFPIKLREQRAMLALSTRPWIAYAEQGRYMVAPVSYEPLEFASAFSSEQCPEGIVAVSKSTLRVLAIDRMGEAFNKTSIALRYTPRSLALMEESKLIAVTQAEHGVLPYEQRQYPQADTVMGNGEGNAGGAEADRDEEDEEEEFLKMEPAEQFGAPRASNEQGTWASCIQLYDVGKHSIAFTEELEENEAAVTCCLAEFATLPGETVLVVGTVKELKFNPRTHSGGFLRVYRLTGNSLALQHATPIENVPGALHPFHGRLLAGVGPILRLYDLGKRKLLRKSESKPFPSMVRKIDSAGHRIYVGDSRESFFFARYRAEDNYLYVFADDSQPRYVTASAHLDYDTMACGDKFGNLSIIRLPKDVSDEAEDDPTGGRGTESTSVLNSAPNKAGAEANFYLGHVVTSLEKVKLQPGGSEVLVYVTNMGSIGALLPFTSREDMDFCSHLEMHMRQEKPPLCGRDHLSYRSHYFPVKNVVDGDLCEQFSMLPSGVQHNVAEQLERSVGEVYKKLEDVRARIC